MSPLMLAGPWSYLPLCYLAPGHVSPYVSWPLVMSPLMLAGPWSYLPLC